MNGQCNSQHATFPTQKSTLDNVSEWKIRTGLFFSAAKVDLISGRCLNMFLVNNQGEWAGSRPCSHIVSWSNQHVCVRPWKSNGRSAESARDVDKSPPLRK